jgi:hypothetical protein
MFWIFNIDPLIEAALTPKAKLLWSYECGNTALAIYHVEPTAAKPVTKVANVLAQMGGGSMRPAWVLKACDRGDPEWSVVAASYVYAEVTATADAWIEWVPAGGSTRAWRERRAQIQRQSFPSL